MIFSLKKNWNYSEAFIISTILLILGFFLEFLANGNGLKPLIFPQNLWFATIFLQILISIRFFFKNSFLVRFLASIPAAISSITLLCGLTFLMGIFPQIENDQHSFTKLLGLTHITRSFAFSLSIFYFLLTLGITILRRILPFNLKNFGFFLNHAGIWLVVISAAIGNGDVKQLSMVLRKSKEYNSVAKDSQKNQYSLDIALRLINFQIDEYSPKIGLLEKETENLVFENQKPLLSDCISRNYKIKLLHFEIVIEKFYSLAMLQDSVFVEKNEIGAAPAAFVKVLDFSTKKEIYGWISSGSFNISRKNLSLNNEIFLAMTIPEVKRFASTIEFISKDSKRDTAILEVNKPIQVDEWKIYQASYDATMGRWSQISVIELISDAWISFVYIGFTMMIFGTFFLFYFGKPKIDEN